MRRDRQSRAVVSVSPAVTRFEMLPVGRDLGIVVVEWAYRLGGGAAALFDRPGITETKRMQRRRKSRPLIGEGPGMEAAARELGLAEPQVKMGLTGR